MRSRGSTRRTAAGAVLVTCAALMSFGLARDRTGGSIGVHGPDRMVRWMGSLVNTFDSTSGCIGIATDDEMAKIAAWVTSASAKTIELR